MGKVNFKTPYKLYLLDCEENKDINLEKVETIKKVSTVKKCKNLCIDNDDCEYFRYKVNLHQKVFIIFK